MSILFENGNLIIEMVYIFRWTYYRIGLHI